MKKAGRFAAIAVLFVTGYLGLSEGIPSLRQDVTPLQRTVNVAVLTYGVLGFVGALGLLRRRRWTFGVTVAWGAAVVWAGTIASFAFHDPSLSQRSTLTGVLGALGGTTLIAGLVVWAVSRNETGRRDVTRA